MVKAEGCIARLHCAQFSSLIMLTVTSHGAASVPGVFGGKGHGVKMAHVWDTACIRGVERTWVGVVLCAWVSGLSNPAWQAWLGCQKIRSADPLDLSQLVLDLRSRHLAYWRQFSGFDP
eukprot:1138653-Pelagomonas_calceolata.AAC.2